MKQHVFSRREFLRYSLTSVAALLMASCRKTALPVVSIARIKDGDIGGAVNEAIKLLGGINAVTRSKQRIMLKPNLVGDNPAWTTKIAVIETLAQLLVDAGKEVMIGEGSVMGNKNTIIGGRFYMTKNTRIIENLQQDIYETLGYTALSEKLGVPLVNLHLGEMAVVKVPDGFVFQEITLNHLLTDIDMLVSVPVMKTHTSAEVTLGMKNLIGTFPGSVYGSWRQSMHDTALQAQPDEKTAAAGVIVDIVRANKLGLTVIDASTAMEGDGPTNGIPVQMDLIIAGTNPLATDIVAADIMGFSPDEVPMFSWANRAGMLPKTLAEIEVRGVSPSEVRRKFKRAHIYDWAEIRDSAKMLP
jgi:uncharacterized protein (DUF362 family)